MPLCVCQIFFLFFLFHQIHFQMITWEQLNRFLWNFYQCCVICWRGTLLFFELLRDGVGVCFLCILRPQEHFSKFCFSISYILSVLRPLPRNVFRGKKLSMGETPTPKKIFNFILFLHFNMLRPQKYFGDKFHWKNFTLVHPLTLHPHILLFLWFLDDKSEIPKHCTWKHVPACLREEPSCLSYLLTVWVWGKLFYA